MTWILLFYIGVHNGGGAAVAEFNTEFACKTAGASLKNNVEGFTTSVRWTCVPKG